jgi:aryl-alcohol dehydrogenase-like predicted oxidoreductase
LALDYLTPSESWHLQETVIPGASRPEQIRANAAATALPPLNATTMSVAREIYDRYIRKPVHDLW